MTTMSLERQIVEARQALAEELDRPKVLAERVKELEEKQAQKAETIQRALAHWRTVVEPAHEKTFARMNASREALLIKYQEVNAALDGLLADVKRYDAEAKAAAAEMSADRYAAAILEGQRPNPADIQAILSSLAMGKELYTMLDLLTLYMNRGELIFRHGTKLPAPASLTTNTARFFTADYIRKASSPDDRIRAWAEAA